MLNYKQRARRRLGCRLLAVRLQARSSEGMSGWVGFVLPVRVYVAIPRLFEPRVVLPCCLAGLALAVDHPPRDSGRKTGVEITQISSKFAVK